MSSPIASPRSRPVTLGVRPSELPPLTTLDLTGVDAALATGVQLGRELSPPGHGATAVLWSTLATIGAADLEAARAIEPHLDALAILDQVDAVAPPIAVDLPSVAARPECTWGVFAAEGPDPLMVREAPEGWVLDGVKPWCSLADRLDAALITATLPGGQRGLFAIDLAHPGVRIESAAWAARGLVGIPSGPISLHGVTGYPVGSPGWYLARPGFEWGGIGVAACWLGGMVGLARAVRLAVERRPERDITAMHLGAVDLAVWTASAALADAAVRVDDGRATGAAARLLAMRVRAVVAEASETVLLHAGHALGPAPLALDAEHAQRVADLQLYIRQHHAEADLASLGRAVAESPEAVSW